MVLLYRVAPLLFLAASQSLLYPQLLPNPEHERCHLQPVLFKQAGAGRLVATWTLVDTGEPLTEDIVQTVQCSDRGEDSLGRVQEATWKCGAQRKKKLKLKC